MAQHEVFVVSFFMTPEMLLVREGPPLEGVPDSKVSTLLRAAASRGVNVYVLLFHETMLPNDSEWAEAGLKHPNIFIVRHRSRFDTNRFWTHHEKVVVVDQQLAIVGGLDLCLGRYDDWQHRISDPKAEIWPGQDYYNPRVKDVTEGRLQADLFDRAKHPRLPWQDISCALLGRPARDVARHCVERWNHARSHGPQYQTLPTALLKRKQNMCNDEMLKVPAQSGDTAWPPEVGPWFQCRAQVVRSVGRWSAGTKTEASPHQMYCELIQESIRFVYIENQFFCSGMEGDPVIGNRVIEALARRVIKAHESQEPFHIIIVLPLLPALEASLAAANVSQPLFQVMYAQYHTLRSFKEHLKSQGVDADKYVSIFGLRTHGVLPDAGLSTEQVYVHSKSMVVDDDIAVVGSANMNDRSLLGMRDSEMNIVMEDVASSTKSPTDTQRGAMAGGVAANLRKALFAQHLGWSFEEVDDIYEDPVAVETLVEMKRIARRNTQIYEDLFGALPSDKVKTWADLAAWRGGSGGGDVTKQPEDSEHARAELGKVQGHLVEFPLNFLISEDLAPSMVHGLLGMLFT